MRDLNKKLSSNQKHVANQLDLVRGQQLSQSNSLGEMRMEIGRVETNLKKENSEARA